MMMRVGSNGWPQAPTGTAPRAESGFRLRPRQATVATGGVGTAAGLLALGAAMPSPRDMLARRRGRAMLGGLGALQRALLAGEPDAAALRGLAGLVEGEDGEDPAMAEAMRALALRARIELLRHEMADGEAVASSR